MEVKFSRVDYIRKQKISGAAIRPMCLLCPDISGKA
jgi:hypothetical protein